MVSATQLKEQVKRAILNLIIRDTEIDRIKTAAALSYQTGFTEKKILEIMDTMAKVGKIQRDGNILKGAEKNGNTN